MSSLEGGTNSVIRARRATKVPRSKQVLVITILPLVICVLLILPVGSLGKKEGSKSESEGKNGNSTKDDGESSGQKVIFRTDSEDYWVGSNKLEFKPHPRLITPSTQIPSAQIPIPIIEFGFPPTLTPDGYTDDDSSSEEEKPKVKQRKSRDRRKKSRDQRRLQHRTLWANASMNNAYMMKALQSNPQMLQQNPYSNGLRQPVILTGGGAMASPLQSPFILPPPSSRNDESFHGSASTWNINHPGNNLQNYYPPTSNLGSDGGQENRYAPPGYPRSSSIQNFQFGYSQPQRQQVMSSQPQQLGSATQPYPINLGDPESQMYGNSQPQYQFGGSSGNGGPYVVYVSPSGNRAMTQASASGPIPMKAFNSLNEIPVGIGYSKPHLHFNPAYFSGSVSHSPSQSNPQYLRNNFLRTLMDKLANVGKALPIPFVTKYSHSPQGYNHLHRRM